MKALLVIDMQLGSFKPYTLRHDTMGVIARINNAARHFRSRGHMVIFIQHDGSKEQSFIPHTPDWQLLPELEVQSTDIIIAKTANDAFYKTALQETLQQHNITALYFTGCATDFCVDTTIKSALSKDYNITVVSDCHTTADRPGISAQTVIQYFNWLWADITPTKSKITVTDYATLAGKL